MKSTVFAATATAVLVSLASTAHAIPDHLQCFKIKDLATKAAYSATLTPTDPELPLSAGCTVKVPAKLLCVDTTKSAVTPTPPGAPDGEPAQTYLCYKVKCPVFKPTWSGSDQFGEHDVTVKKTDLLCAPVTPAAPTTTLPPAECATASDCPGSDTECQARTCDANQCGFVFTAAGTALSSQTSGDCQQLVCDGSGSTTSAADNADLPDDGNECTDDLCAGGTPTFSPRAAGEPCSQNGGTICDGAGSCVDCATAADCPGIDTECQVRTCTNGACGTEFTPAGTPLSSQTTGDCQQLVCDGSGTAVAENDDGDVPDDGDECTNDLCVAGTPTFTPVADGTSCSQNGGTQCQSGICVP